MGHPALLSWLLLPTLLRKNGDPRFLDEFLDPVDQQVPWRWTLSQVFSDWEASALKLHTELVACVSSQDFRRRNGTRRRSPAFAAKIPNTAIERVEMIP
jgi:hypothetical protein